MYSVGMRTWEKCIFMASYVITQYPSILFMKDFYYDTCMLPKSATCFICLRLVVQLYPIQIKLYFLNELIIESFPF